MLSPTRSRSEPLGFQWHIVPFLALWLMACWGLSGHWTLNPQYHYGWFVPALAIFAGHRRWQTRPSPGAPVPVGTWVASVFCVLLLPAWFFLQPNPDWPLLNWAFVAQIIVILMGALLATGGWRWLGHFIFPVALLFAAVPWPDFVESPLMQFLMRMVASTALAGLDLIGITAIQRGNLLEVVGGVVGVDEACSGIRSLQGSLTASIFLGELFRFDPFRRVLLVALSVIVAFVTNVLRVSFLAWSAAHSGVASVDRVHDPAGMTVLAICVGAILVVTLLLDRNSPADTKQVSALQGHPLPRWFAPAVAAWIGVTIIGAEVWYYDSAKPPDNPWSAVPPASSNRISVPPNIWVQLRYDDVTSAAWSEPAGPRWQLYFFDWKFGPAFSRVAAQMHRPDICLPATGCVLKEDRGIVDFEVDGVRLPFHAYTFEQGSELLFVYHGIWQYRSERGLRQGRLSQGKQMASIQSVLWRERYIGQQAAELAVWGFTQASDADDAFRRIIPSVLRQRSTSSAGVSQPSLTVFAYSRYAASTN